MTEAEYRQRRVDEYQSATERSKRKLKRLMVGGLAGGLAGLVGGNVLDSDLVRGMSYGFIGADVALYLVHKFNLK